MVTVLALPIELELALGLPLVVWVSSHDEADPLAPLKLVDNRCTVPVPLGLLLAPFAFPLALAFPLPLPREVERAMAVGMLEGAVLVLEPGAGADAGADASPAESAPSALGPCCCSFSCPADMVLLFVRSRLRAAVRASVRWVRAGSTAAAADERGGGCDGMGWMGCFLQWLDEIDERSTSSTWQLNNLWALEQCPASRCLELTD